MDFKSNYEVMLVVGGRGTGKTTFAKQIRDGSPRFAVYDPLMEYTTDKTKNCFRLEDINWKDDQIVFSPRLYALHAEPGLSSEDKQHYLFDKFCELLYYSGGNRCLVVDELHNYCSPYKMPPFFRKIITEGRHLNIGFCGVSQRIALTNATIFSLSHHIVSFRQHSENDLKTIRNVYPRGSEKIISRLPNFEALYFDNNQTLQRIYVTPGGYQQKDTENIEEDGSENQVLEDGVGGESQGVDLNEGQEQEQKE